VKDLPSPDLLNLALAPMSERVAALRSEWSRGEETGPLPSRAVQIAGLIVGETVRLIRLGSSDEVTAAALALSKVLARPETAAVAAEHPESHRLASGASIVLGAAGAPASGGGELAVLRSWSGKAKEAVEMLNRAHGHAIARSQLRSELGDLTESHLSHLLADLESAGLALRIKEGKTVTVHLGPNARSEHVQEQLSRRPLPVGFRSTERDLPAGAEHARYYARFAMFAEEGISGDLKKRANRTVKPLGKRSGDGGLCDSKLQPGIADGMMHLGRGVGTLVSSNPEAQLFHGHRSPDVDETFDSILVALAPISVED
jgi:DNA-binding transcriptional ArsR family regulator